MLDDIFYDYVLPIVIVVAAGVFVCSQYDLCVANPDEWFTGAVAGVIAVYSSLVRSNSVRSRKRE